MSRRRFAVLAVAVLALNAFFWLAQGGFALPRAMIDQFFGGRMIRAEVLLQGQTASKPVDYRIDRGVITAVGGGSITLAEQDGTSWTIPVAPDARVAGARRLRVRTVDQLRPKLRVVVYRIANAPADLVQVEGRGAGP